MPPNKQKSKALGKWSSAGKTLGFFLDLFGGDVECLSTYTMEDLTRTYNWLGLQRIADWLVAGVGEDNILIWFGKPSVTEEKAGLYCACLDLVAELTAGGMTEVAGSWGKTDAVEDICSSPERGEKLLDAAKGWLGYGLLNCVDRYFSKEDLDPEDLFRWGVWLWAEFLETGPEKKYGCPPEKYVYSTLFWRWAHSGFTMAQANLLVQSGYAWWRPDLAMAAWRDACRDGRSWEEFCAAEAAVKMRRGEQVLELDDWTGDVFWHEALEKSRN